MLYPQNSRWNRYLISAGADRSGNEMTVRRSRFQSVPPGYFSSTKGHSSLKRWYPTTTRASSYLDDIYYPEPIVRSRGFYDTTREENEIRRDVNHELLYTSNLVDDTYDIANKSRNRDQMLLREATRALVDTETFASPRSAVTSRRVRQTSVVRTPTPVTTSRAVSCPPVSRGSSQAALVGNRVEVVTPRKRKPRSTYAANKMRELKRDEREMEVEAVPVQSTTSLKASTVSPNYKGGKLHWDEDGKVTQPTNLMSWQYRIESRVPPGDHLFPVKTIGHVRDKLLHVKEQMDRHRQLMDRYLPDEDSKTDVKTKIMNMYVDMEQHNPAFFRSRGDLLTTKSSDNSSSLRAQTPSPTYRARTPFRAGLVRY